MKRLVAAIAAAAVLTTTLAAAPASAALYPNGLHLNGVGSTGVKHGAPGRPAAFNPGTVRLLGVTVW